MIKDMNRRGFTITELLIVIVIMGILLTLGVVNLRGSQVSSRDSERKSDIDALALHLESYYSNGNDSTQALVDCTGGTITHNGGYTIHTFTVSGTLTCSSSLNADILVVGGGGGGGNGSGNGYEAGGGGGGGLIYSPSFSVSASPYTVTVGNGGAAQTNGQNSIFPTLTAIGGGAGATSLGSGALGGSGGGGAHPTTGGGANTAGQGFAGGSGSTSRGGGGGGAGQAGGVTGLGGNGLQYSISGTPTYYSGGGGAYLDISGGLGGGGTSTTTLNSSALTAGSANTGGGGAGSYSSGTIAGGAGGSGVVIVRYLTPGTTTAHTTTYPSTVLTTAVTIDNVHTFLRDIDLKAITAPGITDPAITLISATCTGVCVQTPGSATTSPTFDQYMYQPLKSDGSLCTSNAQECVEFNLYYRLEADNTVHMVTSRHQ